MQTMRAHAVALVAVLVLSSGCPRSHAQAALLLEEPYGLYGAVNPTGHVAIYLARVCADSPLRLRRCLPGENGSVVSRYQGIEGYDWVAMPLVPYLYSVEKATDVPAHVNGELVARLRDNYHEAHLASLGQSVPTGNLVHGGWTELVGTSFERRTFVFRFDTTPEQDDALIARLNASPNRSHFNMFYNNCADFGRKVLNTYFPHRFGRSFFPDAGMTTPKQIAYKLVRYSRRHPEAHLTVMEIPMVPGYEHLRRSNNGVAEALFTTGYAIPLAFINPYIAGGLLIDYLVRGRYELVPRRPEILAPDHLDALTAAARAPQNALSAGTQAAGAARNGYAETQAVESAHSGLTEIKATHE
jgi:hypothetical protein